MTGAVDHDPGGKSTFGLPSWVNEAGADMSECGRFRFSLFREWRDMMDSETRSILFIGLNPSMAEANVDDPTCRREVEFARDWGFTRYSKANVIPYRATSPKDLSHVADMDEDEWDGAVRRNVGEIRRLAADSGKVVLAYGRLPANAPDRCIHALNDALDAAEEAVAESESLFCFGLNKDGSPKHPLYLRRDSILEEWKGN